MPSLFARLYAACIVFTVLVSIACPAVGEDEAAALPLEDRIAEAEQAFEEAVEAERRRLDTNIDLKLARAIKLANRRQDAAKANALQAQLDRYRKDQTLPDADEVRSSIKSYRVKLQQAGDLLLAVYNEAKDVYTEQGDGRELGRIQTKMKWLRPTTGLDLVEYEGHHYLLVMKKVLWSQAFKACEELGGYLVCLNSGKERRFVHQLRGENPRTIWLGATDRQTEGKWVWLDGTDKYWVWDTDEPNDSLNNEDFGSLLPDGRMNDLPDRGTGSRIHTPEGYVCEWEVLPTRETFYRPGASTESVP
ncbi:MAG: C-type lectin domain-containing protein [Phycisphaeraceae bacterium]|nr:C-type lectin domain-containing protein [Phycisphaeraceae bacterium]